ncbi:hypothetical protein [Tsukamurella tyrosinosolvens]|uniref:hypothetical protein n=1 Tax=Tsukamurella tyrosinosolvens TaxID=57704 RepID=UPI002DD43AA7|nr:hypothetical protein [Tsukamurella tyrosinosolvens]MEC4616200.1 hypothetical protein [Tsukamurella tyrosinosolvens]
MTAPQTPTAPEAPAAPAQPPTPAAMPQQATPPAPEKPFEAITSQADLDKIIGQRIARERQQITTEYGDLAALKDKATKFEEGERAKLDEVERLKADLAASVARADAAEFESVRASVAATKGVPPSALTGKTREELEAAADALIAWRGTNEATPPKPAPDPTNLRSGATGTGASGSDPKADAAEALRRFRAG